jgi:hypothetical protein
VYDRVRVRVCVCAGGCGAGSACLRAAAAAAVLKCPGSLCGAQADISGDGTLDYEEFLAATMNLAKLEHEEHLYMCGVRAACALRPRASASARLVAVVCVLGGTAARRPLLNIDCAVMPFPAILHRFRAFKFFDADDSGFITAEELATALSKIATPGVRPGLETCVCVCVRAAVLGKWGCVRARLWRRLRSEGGGRMRSPSILPVLPLHRHLFPAVAS